MSFSFFHLRSDLPFHVVDLDFKPHPVLLKDLSDLVDFLRSSHDVGGSDFAGSGPEVIFVAVVERLDHLELLRSGHLHSENLVSKEGESFIVIRFS